MSRVCEELIYPNLESLAIRSNYTLDFLMDMYIDIWNEDGFVDWNYFEVVTLENDW
jgi:hypothetical protein